jgi:hypothetical protein
MREPAGDPFTDDDLARLFRTPAPEPAEPQELLRCIRAMLTAQRAGILRTVDANEANNWAKMCQWIDDRFAANRRELAALEQRITKLERRRPTCRCQHCAAGAQ